MRCTCAGGADSKPTIRMTNCKWSFSFVYLINLSLENNIEISGSFFYKGKAVLYKLDIETISVKIFLFVEHAL